MTNLRLIHTEPPELDDDGDDGDGGEGDETVAIDVSILDADWVTTNTSRIVPVAEATPERVAFELIQTVRAAACAYGPDTQLSLEHRLLSWGRTDGG